MTMTGAPWENALNVAGTLLVSLPSAWAALALWFQAPGGRRARGCAAASWLLFSAVLVLGIWTSHAAEAMLLFAAAFTILARWWRRILPSNERDWADEVARITTGHTEGSQVVLHNVRNFEWRTPHDYVQRWETRCYDLDLLDSLDMIMSYWSGPAIAHMLISFGFCNGEQLAFSVEVRRARHACYSQLGGFFKAFELSIIAADERDVVRLRTNVRGEDDYLYRLKVPPHAIRSLFLAYLDEANALVRTPRFYNTLNVNCTTLVYHMMKRIVGRLPLDHRILLSGYFPEYVYSVGGMDQRFTLQELRAQGYITPRALKADRSRKFSADIRRGVPAIDPSVMPEAARPMPAEARL